jgi:two-component system phosphate regulon sensor histidine kinase PhoR
MVEPRANGCRTDARSGLAGRRRQQYGQGVRERELERKAKVAEILLAAARQLAEGLEPERVYERFQELLSTVIEHDGLVISSYDELDDRIRCEYVWNEGSKIDPSTLPSLPLNRAGGGMQSRVIVSGESLLFNDVPEHVRKREGEYYNVDPDGTIRKIPDAGPAGTKAAMMVPVKLEGRVAGVVQLMTDHGVYTQEQVELFEGLVAQMAASVRNARLQKERTRLEAGEAAAQAVAAEREQAAQVLEAVGDGIFLVDQLGVVRLWNRAAELITGLRGEAVRDRPLSDAIAEWAELAERIPIASGGAKADAVTLPVQIGSHDLWLSFVAVDSDAGVIYAFRDLTNETRLEEEKNDLVATISHELRTPITAVYGAATTLLHREAALDERQRRQLLEVIEAEGRRLAHITEEVLLTSQLDREDLRITHEAVNVADVVRTTVEAMGTRLPDAAPIELNIRTQVGAASGDPNRIQQVVLNLLDNAIKYGGADGVAVHVDAENGAIRIAVSDKGPGIELAEQERIFEKFYRADPQLAQAPAGTGLGLYISRELVERMGGSLRLISDPGEGATFTVSLPAA